MAFWLSFINPGPDLVHSLIIAECFGKCTLNLLCFCGQMSVCIRNLKCEFGVSILIWMQGYCLWQIWWFVEIECLEHWIYLLFASFAYGTFTHNALYAFFKCTFKPSIFTQMENSEFVETQNDPERVHGRC